MTTTQREFLTTAAATAAAMTPDLTHEHQQGHTHDHEHQVVPSDPTLRVEALESLLVEKRIVDRARKEAWADAYRHTLMASLWN